MSMEEEYPVGQYDGEERPEFVDNSVPADPKDQTTLFVRNLGFDVTNLELQEHFEDIGPVKHAFVVQDRMGVSRGYGFVQFVLSADRDRAAAAKNGSELSKRQIKVEIAGKTAEREEHSKKKAANREKKLIKKEKAKKVKKPAADTTSAHSRCVLIYDMARSADHDSIKKGVEKLTGVEVETVIFPAPESTDGGRAARLVFKTVADAHTVMKKLEGKEIHKTPVKTMPLGEKAARLIVRNLAFRCSDKVLEKRFSPHGEVREVTVPLKPDGTRLGPAFVQFSDMGHAYTALKAMNGLNIMRRPIAVDWALSKNHFKHALRLHEESVANGTAFPEAEDEKTGDDNEKQEADKKEGDAAEDDEGDLVVGKKEEEIAAGSESDDSDSGSDSDSDSESGSGSSSSSDSDDEDDNEEDDDDEEKSHKRTRTPRESDTKKGATLFLRNVAYDTTEEMLKDRFSKYGQVKLAKMVIDKQLDRPRGTAFVQFWNSEDALKCLKDAGEPITNAKVDKHTQRKLMSMGNSGILLGGRRLIVALAVDRNEADRLNKEGEKKREDKRNLFLAYEGTILEGDNAAEGLSAADLAKRKKAWSEKKAKLKNPNYSVSNVRLSVRNMPVDLDEKGLRAVFLKAAKNANIPKPPKIVQSKILRDSERTDADGNFRSKRYGFVEFAEHEHSMAALRSLNNNPKIWTKDSRPIVEFALDDARKVLTRKRRVEQRQRTEKSKGPKERKQKCFNCGSDEHRAKDCSQPKKRKRDFVAEQATGEGDSASNGSGASNGSKRDNPFGKKRKGDREERGRKDRDGGRKDRDGGRKENPFKKDDKRGGREKRKPVDELMPDLARDSKMKKSKGRGEKLTKAQKKEIFGEKERKLDSLVDAYQKKFFTARDVKSKWYE